LAIETNKRVSDRISTKLARVTVVAAFGVGMVMSCLQVYRDYIDANHQLATIVTESLIAVDKAATRAVLLIDAELATEVISGLFEYDYVSSASIVDENGSVLAARERDIDGEADILGLNRLLNDQVDVFTRDLALEDYIAGAPGKLTVTVDRSIGLIPFLDRAIVVFISGIVHSIAVALVLYIAFHAALTRPITALLDQISDIDPEQPGGARIRVAEGHRHDELGQLGVEINRSYDAIQVLLDNLRSTNRALTTSEEALRRRSWELEQEVERSKQTTLDLISTKEQAEAANRAKSVFLANVSHELRTPLNAIIGFSSIMGEEMFGPIGHDRYRGYLTDIRSSSEHLSDVLGEVLDLAKIEAGQVRLEEEAVDIRDLVDQCVLLVSSQALSKGIKVVQLSDDDLPGLFCDQLRVKQSVVNLLSNAVKFTPKNGAPVEAHLYIDPEDGSLAIQIQDRGVGIAREEHDIVFSPFIRSSTALSRSHEGTGLGLALVKSFVEKHDGWVTLESALGEGSVFTLHFPKDRCVDVPEPLSPEISAGDPPLQMTAKAVVS